MDRHVAVPGEISVACVNPYEEEKHGIKTWGKSSNSMRVLGFFG